MKKEGLIKIRNTYYNLLEEKRKEEKIIEELTRIVMEKEELDLYASVIEKEKNKVLTESQIIRKAVFSVFCDNVFDQDIFVYMGSYFRLSDRMKDVYIEDKRYADYIFYLNLENEFNGVVREQNQYREFEDKHIILTFNDMKNHNILKEKFYDIQTIYYKELIEGKNTEQVIEKVKSYL